MGFFLRRVWTPAFSGWGALHLSLLSLEGWRSQVSRTYNTTLHAPWLHLVRADESYHGTFELDPEYI